jgi:hypothetical protein
MPDPQSITTSPATTPEPPLTGEQVLAEATTDSLNELFSREPIKLTDADHRAIVAKLRDLRKTWLVEEAAGKKKASNAKPKAPPRDPNAPKKKLSLADIGFLNEPIDGGKAQP